MMPQEKAYDVVVVGGGAAGLTTAAEATAQGLKVLVLEKGKTTGGGGNYMEGAFAINSWYEKEQGSEMDPQALLDSALHYSHYLADNRSLRQFMARSADNIQWLTDLGVKFAGLMYTMHFYEGGGKAVVDALKARALAAGAEILTGCKVTGLTTRDGAVTGVTLADGTAVVAKAVVLATGGYVDSPEMIDQATAYNGNQILAISTGKSTGDGLRLAYSVGARKYKGCIQFSGGEVKNTSKPPYANWRDQLNGAANQQGLLWVNEAGDRFMNENQVLDSFNEAGGSLTTQNKIFTIFDQTTIDHLTHVGILRPMNNFNYEKPNLPDLQQELEDAIAAKVPYIHKADTVAALATAAQLPNLVATVTRYNELVDAGVDTDFGKDAKYLLGLTQGPFYAVEDGVAAFCAIGGLQVDLQNRVLAGSGRPIAGLYAAGNDAVGVIEGESYNANEPGTTSAYTIYSGRNAAQAIAQAQ